MLTSNVENPDVSTMIKDHTDVVRNATTCIRGIVEKAIAQGSVTKRALKNTEAQLRKIEDSLSLFVQRLSKGNHDG